MRLFVAVRPPDDVLDDIAGLPRPDHPGVRWTTRDQWHVTLRFLGEVDDPAPVAAALGAAPLPAAEAVVGHEVVPFGRQVIGLPVRGLDALAAAVAEATATCGDPPGGRRFQGHLTLARLSRRRVGNPPRARDLTGAQLSARFPIDAVRLVRSHLGPGPARYEDLHVRPLPSPRSA